MLESFYLCCGRGLAFQQVQLQTHMETKDINIFVGWFIYRLSVLHWKAPSSEVSPVILRGKMFQLEERLRAGLCKSMRKKRIFADKLWRSDIRVSYVSVLVVCAPKR